MTRSGFKRVLLLAIFFIGIAAVNSYAAWWDLNRVPVPHRTEAVQKREPDLTSGSFEAIYYISALSREEISDFYLRRLTDQGWRQKKPLEELSRISAPGLLPIASQSFSDCLIFEKGAETLIVRFTSLRNRSTRKGYDTNYIVSRHERGEIDFANYPIERTIPESEQKLPPGLLPEYPGATLVGLTQEGDQLYAAYHTNDGIQRISSYYADQMPVYGWQLESETPAEDCPNCQKNNRYKGKIKVSSLAQQNYINQEGGSCYIIMSAIPDFAGSAEEAVMIAVHYKP